MIYTTDELKAHITPIAEKYGLPAIYLFGSYANGTAKSTSDIDLLIDTTGTSLRTLFDLGQLYCELESALNKPIDLITLSSLEQPHIMEADTLFCNRVMEERKVLYTVAW